MSEGVKELPAAKTVFARMIGVVLSPVEAFAEIAARPGWIVPFACYLAVFVVAFSVYAARADWVGILSDQIESNPFMKFAPEEKHAEIISQATKDLRAMTPGQQAAGSVIQYSLNILPFYHVMALVYGSLFVMMGALPNMKVGRAWVNFLLCLGLLVLLIVVAFVSKFAFKDSPQSGLLLNGTAGVVMTAAWFWLLKRRTDQDPEFDKVLSVCAYSTVVGMVFMLAVLGVSLASQGPIQAPIDKLVKTNLNAVVQSSAPILKVILESLDVFTLWTLLVLTIGFRAITKLSTGVVASITLLPWGIYVMFRLAFAAIG